MIGNARIAAIDDHPPPADPLRKRAEDEAADDRTDIEMWSIALTMRGEYLCCT